MDKYETTPGVLNAAETCAASISIDDLEALSEDKSLPGPLKLSSRKLTYGPIRGSPALRERLASLYSVRAGTPLPAENILVTPGAIAANFLVLYSLLGPSDHVICVYPTYQQLYSVPESLGAEVSLWQLKQEKKWIPDIDELEGLVKDNTKMIIINNPNNPTGAAIPKTVLTSIIEFASKRDIIVFSDEVYRPLFHGISPLDAEFPRSILSMGYAKTVITGSMSKAYSLAGIRVGWIGSRSPELIEAFASARDYTTISVSQIDDSVASYAISDSVIHSLLARNIQLARTNLKLLDDFIDNWSKFCDWVKPNSGTTAFVSFRLNKKPVDDERLCMDVLEKTNVMLVPGSKCFGGGADFKGFVRIGYVCETEVLKEALAKLEEYMKEHYRDLE